MKLSYIIPTYNLPPEDIRRCLTSLTEQGLCREAYEVVVVDDESDVSPEPIVREFEQTMNVRFMRQPHARQGAARNLGIRQATGDYIRFVDADDYLPPHTAAPLLDVMDKNALDILIFGFREEAPNASRKGRRSSPTRGNGERIFPSGKAYMEGHTVFGSPCTLCFRRTLLEAPPALVCGEHVHRGRGIRHPTRLALGLAGRHPCGGLHLCATSRLNRPSSQQGAYRRAVSCPL